MNKKELIQLIRIKSKEVEIKDFSNQILEKVKHLPQKEMIQTPKRVFRLTPVILVTLGTFASVLLLMVLYNPAAPILPTDPTAPTLENMDQVIALSTVSTASLIEAFDEELSTQDYDLLQFGSIQEYQRINDEIIDVTKYMETIEKLFASQSDFGIEKETISIGTFTNRMRFKTKDLLNQEVDYKFDYNTSSLTNPDHFDFDGELEIADKRYYISGTAETDSNHLSLKAQKDTLNYIVIDYEMVDSTHQFVIETVKNGESIQKVQFQYEKTESNKLIKLEFIDGESIGSYQFQVEENENVKVIRTMYSIITDEDEEKGEFVLRIISIQNRTIYSILVKPEGKTPFVITRGRIMIERRPRLQSTLENIDL